MSMQKAENEFAVELDEEFYYEYNEAYLKLQKEMKERDKLFDEENKKFTESLRDDLLFLKNIGKLTEKIDMQIKRAEELVKKSKTQNEDTFPTLTTKY